MDEQSRVKFEDVMERIPKEVVLGLRDLERAVGSDKVLRLCLKTEEARVLAHRLPQFCTSHVVVEVGTGQLYRCDFGPEGIEIVLDVGCSVRLFDTQYVLLSYEVTPLIRASVTTWGPGLPTQDGVRDVDRGSEWADPGVDQ